MGRASLVELQYQLYLWNISRGMTAFAELRGFLCYHWNCLQIFIEKNLPNCFRSTRPLVSAGACLLVFNAAEWQMRIRDHEMASSLHGPALWDSRAHLTYTAAAPTPTLTQKSISWKKKIWLNTSSKHNCVWEGREKNQNLFCVFYSWPLVSLWNIRLRYMAVKQP